MPSKLEKYEDYTSKGSIYGDGLYTTSKKILQKDMQEIKELFMKQH